MGVDMDPVIGGALIAAGAGLFAGKKARDAARENALREMAMQKEFAQFGVRWKVADAEAAGVHPLFAMGGSTQGYTPSSVSPDYSDVARAGEHLGSALAASSTTGQRALAKANLRALESQVNASDAQASMFRSQAMLNLRDFQSPPFPSSNTDVITDPVSGALIRRHAAEEDISEWALPSGGRQVSAGKLLEYGWQQYDFGNGPVTLIRGDPDQLMSDLQDMDAITKAAIVAENTKRGQLPALMKLLDFTGPQKAAGKEYGKRWGGYNPYIEPTYPRGRVRESSAFGR